MNVVQKFLKGENMKFSEVLIVEILITIIILLVITAIFQYHRISTLENDVVTVLLENRDLLAKYDCALRENCTP